MDIDTSLYPDVPEEDLPASLDTPEERADYLHRLCSSWDFYGFGPSADTLKELRGWGAELERFPLPASPAYHALRVLAGLPPIPVAPYMGTLRWEELDRAEGRDPDPYLSSV